MKLPRPSPTVRRLALAGLLGAMAVAHVVEAESFERIVPDGFPVDPSVVNQFAAVAEGGIALLLANPRTSRFGGHAAMTWFLGIWPLHWIEAPNGMFAGNDVGAVAWLRVPLQIPLILWSWRVAADARRDSA